jgi:hypothetical protein
MAHLGCLAWQPVGAWVGWEAAQYPCAKLCTAVALHGPLWQDTRVAMRQGGRCRSIFYRREFTPKCKLPNSIGYLTGEVGCQYLSMSGLLLVLAVLMTESPRLVARRRQGRGQDRLRVSKKSKRPAKKNRPSAGTTEALGTFTCRCAHPDFRGWAHKYHIHKYHQHVLLTTLRFICLCSLLQLP